MTDQIREHAAAVVLADAHGALKLPNGMTVCVCGAGNRPGSLPYYRDAAPDPDTATRSLEAYGDHVVAVIEYLGWL